MAKLRSSKRPFDLAVHTSIEEAGVSEGVHLWLLDLDRTDGLADSSLVTTEESERAGRLRDITSRRRMLRRFALSRLVLAKATGAAPDMIAFVYGVCGKPKVVPVVGGARAGNEVSFNISHSENVLVVAVGFGVEIGVDLEVVEGTRGTPDFYRRWTEQEAISKLTGVGIAFRGRRVVPTTAQVRSLDATFAGRRVILAVAVAEPSLSPDPYQGPIPENLARL